MASLLEAHHPEPRMMEAALEQSRSGNITKLRHSILLRLVCDENSQYNEQQIDYKWD